jgi:hypothetical protein
VYYRLDHGNGTSRECESTNEKNEYKFRWSYPLYKNRNVAPLSNQSHDFPFRKLLA